MHPSITGMERAIYKAEICTTLLHGIIIIYTLIIVDQLSFPAHMHNTSLKCMHNRQGMVKTRQLNSDL